MTSQRFSIAVLKYNALKSHTSQVTEIYTQKIHKASNSFVHINVPQKRFKKKKEFKKNHKNTFLCADISCSIPLTRLRIPSKTRHRGPRCHHDLQR